MENKPVVILVKPQMGENIGAAARAMFNCGLTDLRLVAPRDGWPNERAFAMSSGALDKMPGVEVFDTLEDALADCHYVYVTTARLREMERLVLSPRQTAEDIYQRTAQGQKTALVFGPERAGLSNDDVALSHALINIPMNPDFTSLNLGQAVLIIAYEWFQHNGDVDQAEGLSFPAPHASFVEMCERLESELESRDFFRSPDMKPHTIRNLRTMLARAQMTEQEVRTFHGIISALIRQNN